MKYYILTTVLLLSVSGFGQEISQNKRQQLFLSAGIGFSQRSIESIKPDNFSVFDYRKTQVNSNYGFKLQYNYRPFKKRNFFLNTSYRFSATDLNHQLIDPRFGRHLDNIDVRSTESVIGLGINYQLPLYEGRLILNFGFSFLKQLPHNRVISLTSDFKSNNEDWIRYRYDYDLYHGSYMENDAGISQREFNRLNSEITVEALFKLSSGYFSLGLVYARNNYRFYDYFAQFEYYLNGSPVPTEIYTINPGEVKSGLIDHFLSLRLGYGFSF